MHFKVQFVKKKEQNKTKKVHSVFANTVFFVFCKKEKLDLSVSTLRPRQRFVTLPSCSISMAGISDLIYEATVEADSGALAESHTVGHKCTSVNVIDKLVEVTFKAV